MQSKSGTLQGDLLSAADNITNTMSSLVRQLGQRKTLYACERMLLRFLQPTTMTTAACRPATQMLMAMQMARFKNKSQCFEIYANVQ